MTSRPRTPMSGRDKGFTLIELLVVVLIVGVIAAIAVPVFLNQRKKGVDASLKADLKSAATAAEAYATENPTDTDFESGLATPANFAGGGFKKTTGNSIHVYGGPAGGYCLRAQNLDGASSGVGTARFMFYDSLNGGLQPGFHTGSANPCTVPGSSGTWISI